MLWVVFCVFDSVRRKESGSVGPWKEKKKKVKKGGGGGGGDRLSAQLVMTMFKRVDYLRERNVVIDSNQQAVVSLLRYHK